MLASFPSSLASFFFPPTFENCLFENGLLELLPSFISTVPQLVQFCLSKLLLFNHWFFILSLLLISMPYSSFFTLLPKYSLIVSCPCSKTLTVPYYFQDNIYSPQYGTQSLLTRIANAVICGILSMLRNTPRLKSCVPCFCCFIGTSCVYFITNFFLG